MPEVTIHFTKDKTYSGIKRFEAVRSDDRSIYLTIEQHYRNSKTWQVYRRHYDGPEGHKGIHTVDTYDIGMSREQAKRLAEKLLGQTTGQEPGGKLIMGETVNVRD